uniref:Uncharacterized protein n=1 Tax=Varanus komodoensis TaxID=61221 RepID=A0A8D2JEN2_VARKO
KKKKIEPAVDSCSLILYRSRPSGALQIFWTVNPILRAHCPWDSESKAGSLLILLVRKSCRHVTAEVQGISSILHSHCNKQDLTGTS